MSPPKASILKWKRRFKATVLCHYLQRFPDSTVKIHIRGTQPQRQPWRQANKNQKSLVILHKSFTGERETAIYSKGGNDTFLFVSSLSPDKEEESCKQMSSGFSSRGSWTGSSSVVTGLYFCLILHFCNLWKWPTGSCKTCCSVETVYRLLSCALEPFSSRRAALPASAWAPPPLANVTWQRARRGGKGNCEK